MKIKGLYGEERTATEWAKLLGVEAELILLCVNAGKTIGEIYGLLNKPYPKPAEKKRKPRESAAMIQTKERMAILLEMSGIAEREDAIKEITVSRVGTHSDHAVTYEGQPLGVYDYKRGGLKLSGGQGVNLWRWDWEDVKVELRASGKWYLHPDTQRLLAAGFKPDNSAEADQFSAAIFQEASAEEQKNRPDTYPGFGKDLTCAEWARHLDVPLNSLWYALHRGETVEEFAARRGIKVNRTPEKGR